MNSIHSNYHLFSTCNTQKCILENSIAMTNRSANSTSAPLLLSKKGIRSEGKQMLTLTENGRCVYAFDVLFSAIRTPFYLLWAKEQLDFGICSALAIFAIREKQQTIFSVTTFTLAHKSQANSTKSNPKIGRK